MTDRWVILDAMGVVFEVADDTGRLLAPFLRVYNGGLTNETVTDLYRRASLGQISPAQFWQAAGLESRYPGIEHDYLDSLLRLDTGFRRAAAALGRTHRLALCSNDVGHWSEHLRERHGLDKVFAHAVISGDVGCRKPDRRIYEVLLERLGADPAACVMVDDRTRNLAPAAALGMKTIHFARESTNGDFLADAEIRSFDDLPAAVARLMG
jgi:putative hydrolase of the HAD superfamily